MPELSGLIVSFIMTGNLLLNVLLWCHEK